MAYQQATLYCGRCGAPLAPGATYCGRCGTPVALQAVAAQPLYRYPSAPAPRNPTPGHYRLAPALIAGGLVVILIVAAVVVGGIAAQQFVSGTHSSCTSNCSPKFVTPLAEEASWRSSAYKFQVNYSSAWTVRSENANGVVLGTKLGYVSVVGSGGSNTDQVLQSTVSALPSSQFQDVTAVSPLKGAHIGNQDGVGEIYSASFVGASQTAAKVRFAVIVASQHNVTVAVFALNPSDVKNFPNGMPEGQAFDYLCTEIVWGS
ncbi:MAG TPA: zinc ribbon domain-containing protein [Candidatus Dormibacteraeota bacterium]|nr:zinc ribbon domain-containing protein [Candidatus Dormibacteraeota bacterium]